MSETSITAKKGPAKLGVRAAYALFLRLRLGFARVFGAAFSENLELNIAISRDLRRAAFPLVNHMLAGRRVEPD